MSWEEGLNPAAARVEDFGYVQRERRLVCQTCLQKLKCVINEDAHFVFVVYWWEFDEEAREAEASLELRRSNSDLDFKKDQHSFL